MEGAAVTLVSSDLRYPPLHPTTLSASTSDEIVGLISESGSSQATTHHHQLHNQDASATTAGFSSRMKKKHSLHRSKTAPAISVIQNLLQVQPHDHHPTASSSIMKQALVLLSVYLSLGSLFYSFNRDNFSGVETHPVVDALYFCIVTMCTIGYGDIAPLTPATKIFACLFVLVGFGFLDILLTGVVNYFLDSQEKQLILSGIRAANRTDLVPQKYMVDVEKGRMRIRLKVGLAVGVLVLCVGTGALILNWMENLDWVDSFYLAVMSVTTVGYGDQAFNTLAGRLFASAWLLVSTLGVARAFLYLAEARIDKRHRRIVKWVLQRDMTLGDWLAADLNNSGFISKSEYVVHKLKEMGKITEKEILLICDQFNKLDPNNSGKITLFDLLAGQPN